MSEYFPQNKKPSPVLNIRTFIILAAVIAGIWATGQLVSASGNLVVQARKMTAIMRLIQSAYVEEPDLERLTEGAIEGMLKRLDPHSTFIPAKQQEEFSERDMGEFEGIGISFVIQNELITVISPITGTPAERLGIHSGDRIVEIDGISAYGITNDEVFRKLRGPKGTSVEVKVRREGVDELLEFTIIRDTIPIYSVVTSFMLEETTGYILLNQFMATTTTELETALQDLESQGMTRLIFDLRNNQGGRLSQAVSVADLFIPGGHVIVSRKSRQETQDSVYYSTDETTHPMFDLIVLINEGSASASEIIAGAVQDLDRGLIAGTISFGKGLVQYPYQLNDGAVIRLSTAHWLTPSGRLIQRSYDQGRSEYYAVRYRDREEGDETEGEEFLTLSGRKIYASSGIKPDLEIKGGTISGATARLLSARLLFTLAEKLIHERTYDSSLVFDEFMAGFNMSDRDFELLKELAKDKDIIYPDEILEKDREYITNQTKAEIAQLLWNNRDFYYVVRTSIDKVITEAKNSFDKAREIALRWH